VAFAMRGSRTTEQAQARPPPERPLITGDERSTLDLASLAVDLTCPVCLGILKNVVSTECLHRFCNNCMEKCLRQGKKECPSCRRHVATRRSLRRDTKFDRVIQMLFPDLQKYEAEQERCLFELDHEKQRAKQEEVLQRQAAELVARARREMHHVELERRLAEGPRQEMQRVEDPQELDRRRKGKMAVKRASPADTVPLPKKRKVPAAPSTAPVSSVSSIVFAVIRHPDEREVKNLEKEILQASCDVQVHHILKLLTRKLKLKESAWTSFRLSMRMTPATAGMPPPPTTLMLDLSLQAIIDRYLSDPNQLVLEYRLAQGFSFTDVQRDES